MSKTKQLPPELVEKIYNAAVDSELNYPNVIAETFAQIAVDYAEEHLESSCEMTISELVNFAASDDFDFWPRTTKVSEVIKEYNRLKKHEDGKA